MEWAKGYVADIGYTSGFFRECTPNHLAFAALSSGRSPGTALQPKRVLELGFGQGFGLALTAAANPNISFEGYDFNPEHVANAQRLIQSAGLANAKVWETSFEEAAAQSDANELDVIFAHGIFSWVSRDTQDAIVAIVRQRLLPHGILYLSYNCMPGWGPTIPIRQFILQVKRQNPGRSSDRQFALAIDLLNKLKDGKAAYFATNPSAVQAMDNILNRSDRVYLTHEFLNENHTAFEFADVVARMGEAKLAFLCSAAMPGNVDRYNCPPELLPLLSATDNPIMRETLRDYTSNRQFRRDVFARGVASMTPPEQRRMLSALRFALAVPRRHVVFNFPIPIGEIKADPKAFAPIADLLADRIASFDQLAALPDYGEGKIGLLLDRLMLLVHSGQVLVVTSASTVDTAPAQRFNRVVVEAARAGRFYKHLAAPVAGTGINVTDSALLLFSAISEGKADDATAAAKHSMALLKGIGQSLAKDGRPITGETEGTAVLEERFAPMLTETVPIWRRLGIC